jgi:hypothetical protein
MAPQTVPCIQAVQHVSFSISKTSISFQDRNRNTLASEQIPVITEPTFIVFAPLTACRRAAQSLSTGCAVALCNHALSNTPFSSRRARRIGAGSGASTERVNATSGYNTFLPEPWYPPLEHWFPDRDS